MISQNLQKIFEEIPQEVTVVAATKGRSVVQILEAVGAGIKIIGENYIQEAEQKLGVLGGRVSCHLIGHLQKNKVKRAVRLFDMIQSLDSLKLAALIDRECSAIKKVMPTLIEVNIAREEQKSGVKPEDLEEFVKKAAQFKNIKLQGLMTMGPLIDDQKRLGLYFQETKQLFDKVNQAFSDLSDWKYLSMGMSLSFKIAIQEGANMIRLGTVIFG